MRSPALASSAIAARTSSSSTVTVPRMPARRSGQAAIDTSAQSSPAIAVPGVGIVTGSPAASDAVRHAAVTGSTPTTGTPARAPYRAAAAASEPTPTGTSTRSCGDWVAASAKRVA
jgi:hypothetical protein